MRGGRGVGLGWGGRVASSGRSIKNCASGPFLPCGTKVGVYHYKKPGEETSITTPGKVPSGGRTTIKSRQPRPVWLSRLRVLFIFRPFFLFAEDAEGFVWDTRFGTGPI